MSREIERLEREIAETRADLDAALDMLQAKVTPSSLLTRAFAHVKEHPGTFTSGLGSMYAHRPFTALLMTAGLNWYLGRRADRTARADGREWESDDDQPRRRKVREIAGRARARVKAGAAHMREEVRERAAEIKHQAEEGAAHAGDVMHRVTDAAKEQARELRQAGSERMSGMKERGAERMHRMMDSGRERSHRLADTARARLRGGETRAAGFFAQQPLLAGALCAVVGVALAAALPASKPKRRAVRPLAKKAAKTARSVTAKAAHVLAGGVERGAGLATAALENATAKIEDAMPARIH